MEVAGSGGEATGDRSSSASAPVVEDAPAERDGESVSLLLRRLSLFWALRSLLLMLGLLELASCVPTLAFAISLANSVLFGIT